MKARMKLMNRVLSAVLCIALLLVYVPVAALRTSAAARSVAVGAVTDPGSAHTFESAMGTANDGNRYAGRVWADKSVYTNGQTVLLNTRGEAESSFQVALENDEAFQIIFSVMGSSMTTTTTTSSVGPMDVVLVLDNSASMAQGSGSVSRLQQTVEAANSLLEKLLTIKNVRIAIVTYNTDSQTILELGSYANGVTLSVDTYSQSMGGGRPGQNRPGQSGSSSSGGVLTAYDKDGNALGGSSTGYQTGTNLQSGIDAGMRILNSATNISGRMPVMVVLTDGRADTAVNSSWYDTANGTYQQPSQNDVTAGVALSTLLNAAYMKSSVENYYGKDLTVYGVGVDLSAGDEAVAIINPSHATYGFNSTNTNSDIRNAYGYYADWANGENVSFTANRVTWTFNQLATNSAVTAEDVKKNIYYISAENYYDVTSANLEGAFDQIYEELSSGVFNPISSNKVTTGGTGVENTPLIYVDDIGRYMEIKEIQAITLFGESYSVIHNADGTYTVSTATGTNPTTNEQWNTTEDILISVTEEADGTQKLEVRINQEILPILLESIDEKTVGNSTTATLTELTYPPLRVYYTVGIDSDVLLPNGEVDVTKIQDYPYIDNTTGEISFYSNAFGARNKADANGVVKQGDAHIGFQPSAQNRYYYHQSNQGVFTKITNRKTGETVTIPENVEYGIVWDEDTYDLTWMSYDEYLAAQDSDTVYTYVTYYQPTASTTDAANAAEEVTYLVYTNWGYLKESVAFYDAATEKYINYNAETGTYSSDDVGYPMSADAIKAYVQAHPEADIYAVLGVGSLRTSRLHNMEVKKSENTTGTAEQSFTPEYTYETAEDHHGNSVVIWLGNNGKLTVSVETGIALTKSVTEAFGDADDTYELTVTVPEGTNASPVVKDASGNTVTYTYENYVLSVQVKAGQTVYITGIPAGTVCAIGEKINGDYYVSSKTDQVTIPSVSDVAAGAQQYVAANVTNAPHKYGNLTVVKDIAHHLASAPEAMAQKVFTFKVQLPVALAGKVYAVDKTNASTFADTNVTVGADGSFNVTLKDNESITIIGLPQDTEFTVTEISNVLGYDDTTGPVTGVIVANRDVQAHFVNAYETTPVQIAVTVTGQKILTDLHNTYADNEDFIFVLSRYVGVSATNESGYLELARQGVKAGGTYRFDLGALVQTLDLGTHYFRVTEESGSTAGMTYDATRGLFAVVVTDENADGTLEYTVTDYANTTVAQSGSGYTVTKNFTNIYDVETTHIDINISKILNNTTGVELPLDLFHFRLVNNTDGTAQPVTATTDASGKATIRISNLKEGNYTYTLTEVDGGMAGMNYDKTAYVIHVTVSKVGENLVAVAEVENAAAVNGDDTVDVTFENTYSLGSASYTPSGNKVLTGPMSIANGAFTFAIYETDASFVIAGSALEKVTNVGNSFTFSKITYTKVGTYYYVIEEVAGNQAGMTYDATHYYVRVTVGIDPEDATKLAVTGVSVNKIGTNSDTTENIVFVNHYAVTGTAHSFAGTKLLHGRALHAHEFTFELYEGDKLIESVTNKADGTFTFSQISYAAAGVYTYTVKEALGTVPGVAYVGAGHPVTVVVTVEDVDSKLQVTKTEYLDSNGQALNGIVFENEYSAQKAQVLFRGEKTLVGGELLDGAFTFKLYKTDYSFNIHSTNAQRIGTQVNANGAFAFDPELFDTTGTFFYAIVEDALVNPNENVVYDSTQYNFRVTVQDDNAGKLLVKVENLTEQTATEFQTAVDTSVGFVNAVTEEAAKKEVFVQKDTTTNIDGETVKPGDVLTYYITYVNYNGKDVVVDILDKIPLYTTYVEGSASHNATFAGDHLNWVLNVAKGESVTVSFSVTVNDEEGEISNIAVIRDGVNTYKTNEVVNEIPVDPIPDIPQTGDSTNLALGLALLVISGAVITGATVLRKKEETK